MTVLLVSAIPPLIMRTIDGTVAANFIYGIISLDLVYGA